MCGSGWKHHKLDTTDQISCAVLHRWRHQLGVRNNHVHDEQTPTWPAYCHHRTDLSRSLCLVNTLECLLLSVQGFLGFSHMCVNELFSWMTARISIRLRREVCVQQILHLSGSDGDLCRTFRALFLFNCAKVFRGKHGNSIWGLFSMFPWQHRVKTSIKFDLVPWLTFPGFKLWKIWKWNVVFDFNLICFKVNKFSFYNGEDFAFLRFKKSTTSLSKLCCPSLVRLLFEKKKNNEKLMLS